GPRAADRIHAGAEPEPALRAAGYLLDPAWQDHLPLVEWLLRRRCWFRGRSQHTHREALPRLLRGSRDPVSFARRLRYRLVWRSHRPLRGSRHHEECSGDRSAGGARLCPAEGRATAALDALAGGAGAHGARLPPV